MSRGLCVHNVCHMDYLLMNCLCNSHGSATCPCAVHLSQFIICLNIDVWCSEVVVCWIQWHLLYLALCCRQAVVDSCMFSSIHVIHAVCYASGFVDVVFAKVCFCLPLQVLVQRCTQSFHSQGVAIYWKCGWSRQKVSVLYIVDYTAQLLVRCWRQQHHHAVECAHVMGPVFYTSCQLLH